MLKRLSCLALALTACSGAAPPPAVTLEIALASPVSLPASGRADVPVTLTLRNGSAAPVTLTGSNECVTHTWTVTDAAGQDVDGRTICPMIYMPRTHVLAPGEWRSNAVLTLDAGKYAAGGHYALHYRFWGVSADAAFSIEKH